MRRLARWIARLLAFIALLLLAACAVAALVPVPIDEVLDPDQFGAGAASVEPSYTGLQRAFPPVAGEAGTPAQERLGRVLFFDPILSGGNETACATCHHPDAGLSSGVALAQGDSGEALPRNAPALWNVAYVSQLFWDGRAESLEAQVRDALTDPDELGSDPDALVAELTAVPDYVALFDEAFGGGAAAITVDNVARAIAAFERSLLSRNSPFDQYAAGNVDALTPPQRRGLALFRSAATRCFECHAAPTFTNHTFRVIGVPDDDPGRAGVAADAPAGAFRVPTLRNVALSAPYMHDGSLATLEEVVDFYADGGGRAHGRQDIDPFVLGFDLSDRERADLVAFLVALTDESALPLTPARVPSGLPTVEPRRNPGRDLARETNAVNPQGQSLRPDRLPAELRVEPGETIQATVDRARPGDTVLVPYGVYHETVVIDISDLTFRGEANDAGDWPVLDGEGRRADGVIASGNNFEMANFVVRHYRSNGVLVEGATGVHLHDLFVEDTGTYGIYPTLCTDVLVENSTAVGMHDAGIYVGKSRDAIVRHNVVYRNVLGIEVENTVTAEIYGNHAYDNATGIFVDLLPNLPSKVSLHTRVYDNLVEDNNHENFAPPEITAALVPSGAGIVLFASDRAEVYDNEIRGNNTAGIGVFALTFAFDANEIDVGPRPEYNRIYGNTLAGNGGAPDAMIASAGIPGADILWDVSGRDVTFDQPGASAFPPVLPSSRWPVPLQRIYWHGLNLVLRLVGA